MLAAMDDEHWRICPVCSGRIHINPYSGHSVADAEAVVGVDAMIALCTCQASRPGPGPSAASLTIHSSDDLTL
jgi:hypothetical protein